MGYLYAILAAVLWGAVYAVDQKILASIPPVLLYFIGSVLTAAVLAPVVFLNSDNLKTVANLDRTTLLLVVTTIVVGILATLSVLYAVQALGAAQASIIEIAYPFFVVLFSILIFRTVPSLAFYAGGALIFFGVSVIIYFQNI